MHRQSLGSPASKLHSHVAIFAGAVVIKDDISNNFISEDLQKHRNDNLASCSAGATHNEERKSQKPYQQKSTSVSSSTRLIHLIPLLTFLCFLILYLSSHDPSRKDLAQFSGFATVSSKKAVIDSIGIDDNAGRGFLEMEKSDVLATRSTRNLQQQERHRFHRKFGQ